MLNKKIQLKVKIKSLAEESQIIRKEIKKSRDVGLTSSLQGHRIIVVRKEARHSLLAYAFLRGKKYSEVENSAHEIPDFVKVGKLVENFGECWDYFIPGSWNTVRDRQAVQHAKFLEWVEEAKSHFLKKEKINEGSS